MLAGIRATAWGTRSGLEELEPAMAAVLREHIAAGDFGAYVVEQASTVLAYGIAMIHQRLPSDWNPGGRWGYIQSMETHPDHRSRGHGTAILAALLDWYRAEGVPAVGVLANPAAVTFYRRLGFDAEPVGQWMVRRDIGPDSP